MDRAVFVFASAVQREQEAAIERLPKTAKQSTHERTAQNVLDTFLGVEAGKVPGRFKEPPVKG